VRCRRTIDYQLEGWATGLLVGCTQYIERVLSCLRRCSKVGYLCFEAASFDLERGDITLEAGSRVTHINPSPFSDELGGGLRLSFDSLGFGGRPAQHFFFGFGSRSHGQAEGLLVLFNVCNRPAQRFDLGARLVQLAIAAGEGGCHLVEEHSDLLGVTAALDRVKLLLLNVLRRNVHLSGPFELVGGASPGGNRPTLHK